MYALRLRASILIVCGIVIGASFVITCGMGPGTVAADSCDQCTALTQRVAALEAANKDLSSRVAGLEATSKAPPPFEGFSFRATSTTKQAMWQNVLALEQEYNTFGNAYDPGTGIFTAPKAGYYRFTAGGFLDTPTNGADARMGWSFTKNGTWTGLSGGQLSTTNSPLPVHSIVLSLAAGDKVALQLFTTIAVTLGSGNQNGAPGHWIWYQGQYLGQ